MSFIASNFNPPPTLDTQPAPCSQADLANLSAPELINRLKNSDYACTELISAALLPKAEAAVVTRLLEMAQTGRTLARRNALRVVGRFAERPENEPANRAVLSQRRDTPREVSHRVVSLNDPLSALYAQLNVEVNEDVLNELLWILDAFFHPAYGMQAYLENASMTKTNSSRLRFRAIAAYARLMFARPQLSRHELDFVLMCLHSDDFWVRAEAAFIFEQLRPEQTSPDERNAIKQALQYAWRNEKELTARQYIARAIDKFNSDRALSGQLRVECESKWLPNKLRNNDITVCSALPSADAQRFIHLMQNTRQAFFELMGSEFSTPVTDDPNAQITLMLFENKVIYADYMNAFVGYGAQAGGLYVEREGRLYTFMRTRAESTYTVEQLIQHEFGHYLQGRYIYPHLWGDSGYHDEPKGWADEGLAEYLAGLQFDSAGRCCETLRPEHVNHMCSVGNELDLHSLICRREGYDQPGTFEYAGAWSFMYYLCTYQPNVVRRIFRAMRNGAYRDEDFDRIAGVPLAQLQTHWRVIMKDWAGDDHAIAAQSPVISAARSAWLDQHDAPTDASVRVV